MWSTLQHPACQVRRTALCSFYSASARRSQSWAQTIEQAQKLTTPTAAPKSPSRSPFVALDPLGIVADEMGNLMSNIRTLLGSSHPSLQTIANYYVEDEGKHIRPLIVLLMSKALADAPKRNFNDQPSGAWLNVDFNLSPLGVLKDWNPLTMIRSADKEDAVPSDGVLPSQRRLAEITEMIHAASLLHDDVIDHADSRRGKPSGNSAFGNKLAILAGDFMLGRASVSLARLRNAEVIELMASVIANLVEGEIMQLRNTSSAYEPAYNDDSAHNIHPKTCSTPEIQAAFEYYMHKTYLKTASLISKSCRSAAVLADVSQNLIDDAYTYGQSIGLAFQLVDDVLDFVGSEKDLGKPADGADLKLGLATAPVLFAWETSAELGPLIQRKFSQPGDVALARKLVIESGSIDKSRDLAKQYCDRARKALDSFPDSAAKDTLVSLATTVLNRKR
ncbi:hypothetical protein CANCADRAFT_113203 [Tortispora caseinolytica NRRL Y-17796]|uniref:Hexaprenyl pyrophosphate synthase n=1 Tax=Tortispora caseinolytica NRRL Y-17796 TaxID=767744 RepID=A0A1E4TGJ9_9ASCO|nr:hypothetical protein CANCADRAFT_113203 [Tortispora caseinolytica NRRL Y-17796]